jgi:hypothetical protein
MMSSGCFLGNIKKHSLLMPMLQSHGPAFSYRHRIRFLILTGFIPFLTGICLLSSAVFDTYPIRQTSCSRTSDKKAICTIIETSFFSRQHRTEFYLTAIQQGIAYQCIPKRKGQGNCPAMLFTSDRGKSYLVRYDEEQEDLAPAIVEANAFLTGHRSTYRVRDEHRGTALFWGVGGLIFIAGSVQPMGHLLRKCRERFNR